MNTIDLCDGPYSISVFDQFRIHDVFVRDVAVTFSALIDERKQSSE
jgi:hypothetical protein